jgi:hypothetical protein
MPPVHSPRDPSKSLMPPKKPAGLPVPQAKSSRYTVFLSHSAFDSESARRVADVICSSGAHVTDWLIEPEKQEQAEIVARLRESHEIVMLVTAHSAINPWLHWEIGLAVGLGKKLTPIIDCANHHELPPPLRDVKALCLDDMEKLRHSLSKRIASGIEEQNMLTVRKSVGGRQPRSA